MSAASSVVQLIRAHFRRDDTAFVSAATALARASKSPLVRNQLVELLRRGYDTRPGESRGQRMPAPPPPGASGLLQALPAVGFPELLLEPELQLFLDEIVTELEYREELAARKLRPRSRLLFYGPPGNGKTSAAAAIANALGVPAYGVSFPTLIDGHLGATGQNLGKLFDALTANTLVVFDELDAVGSERGTPDQACSKELNNIVNTMLTLLDRNRERGILIATTNRPEILDPALLRRWDERIEFPAPTLQQMSALSEKLCAESNVPRIDVAGCNNFDSVTKTVEREARRIVMREILAAEADDEDDSNSSETLN